MEELNKGYEFTKAQIAELESLRAWKAEIEAQEPVAVIGNDYQLLYVGSGPLAPLVLKHGLKVGSKLFAAPVVSPDVEMLELCIIRWKGLYKRESDLYDKLNNENQSLKTELEAARKDAESWRSYKKRKDEVIAAGMGRNVLRDAAIASAKEGA